MRVEGLQQSYVACEVMGASQSKQQVDNTSPGAPATASVELSPELRKLLGMYGCKPAYSGKGRKNLAGGKLSASAAAQVRELERRDAELRRLERQRLAAGGSSNGLRDGDQYIFQTGPDGRFYAVGTSAATSAGPAAPAAPAMPTPGFAAATGPAARGGLLQLLA